jgi:surface protein
MAVGSFSLPISSGNTEWVRPSDWLAMPTVTVANDTFVGLHAVFPEGQNFVAFQFTTSAGQYRVDWGDGTVTLHNSGTVAQYQYDYATVSNATLTSRGYKQAMIVVTPVSGLLRIIDLQKAYVTSPLQTTAYASGFLDCILSMPNASVSSSIVLGSTIIRHSYCERFDIKTIGGCNSLPNLFFQFSLLQSVPLFNTSAVTNMSQMFNQCLSLQNVPLFNTSAITNMSQMFNQCLSLQNVPLFITSAVTNISSMFNGCASLKSIPLFNTSAVTNMSQMFLGCSSLKSVPLFNTGLVTNMSSMFQSCSSLVTIPLFNTSAVTNISSMFSGCTSLQSIPLLNTALVNNMSGMFLSCSSINSIPALSTTSITTTSGTDFGAIFQNNFSLDRCPMVFARTVSLLNCQLSRTALVEVFNNLVSRTLTTSATITISGNWGASALTLADRLIATSKNWIIVG